MAGMYWYWAVWRLPSDADEVDDGADVGAVDASAGHAGVAGGVDEVGVGAVGEACERRVWPWPSSSRVWLPVWVRQLYCMSTGRLKQSSLGLRLRVRARRAEWSSRALGSEGGTFAHGGDVLLDAGLLEAGLGEVLRGADEDSGAAADGGSEGGEVAAGLGGEEEDDLLGLVGDGDADAFFADLAVPGFDPVNQLSGGGLVVPRRKAAMRR